MSFGGIQSLWTRITEKHDVSAVAGQRMLADGIYSAHEAAEYSVAVGAVKCQRGIYGTLRHRTEFAGIFRHRRAQGTEPRFPP